MGAKRSIECRAFAGAEMAQDEVPEDRVLLDAQALAKAFGEPVVQLAGRDAVMLKTGMAARFDARGMGLAEGNEIVLVVHIGPRQGLNLVCRLDMAHHTPGQAEPDHLSGGGLVGVSQRVPRYGWQEAVQAAEAMGSVGTRCCFANAVTLSIRNVDVDGDQAAIAELRLRKVKRARGPRLTDRGLLEQLNLNHPGIEAARDACARDDVPAALQAVVDYYRRRTFPRIPRYRLEPDSNCDTAAADAAFRHVLSGQQHADPVDWYWTPDGHRWWS